MVFSVSWGWAQGGASAALLADHSDRGEVVKAKVTLDSAVEAPHPSQSPYYQVSAQDVQKQALKVQIPSAPSSSWDVRVCEGDILNDYVGQPVIGTWVEGEEGIRLEGVWPYDVVKKTFVNLPQPDFVLKEGQALFPLALLDHRGRLVEHSQMVGEPFLITFFFSRCQRPQMCPYTLNQVKSLAELLQKNGLPKYRLYCVTLDGKRDTPGRLHQHLRDAGLNLDRVSGLTAPEHLIDPLAKACGVHKREDPKTQELVHTTVTLLFSPEGVLKYRFFTNDYKPDELAKALQELAGEPSGLGGKVRPRSPFP